jgi:hypothetical protein
MKTVNANNCKPKPGDRDHVWTSEQRARIDRRRNDPAWELATEEEMANTSEDAELNLKSAGL